MSHTDVERPSARVEHRGLRQRGAAGRAEPALARRAARSTPCVRSRELSIFLVLVAVVVARDHRRTTSFLFSADGWRNLLLNPSILLLLAVGQAVVIITRNVDLSVGSVLALTAYLTGRLFIDQPGHPDRRGAARRACCSARVLGLVNGVLVAFGRVPALVITLGTLYIYRGIVLTWAGSDRINAGDLPRDFLAARHQARCSAIPLLTILALVVLAVVGYYLYTARGGRELYAIGSDPDAAVLYGLPGTPPRARRVRAQRRARRARRRPLHRPLRHRQLERRHRASSCRPSPRSVIGGVAIFGGSGTVWGAAIGAFLLVTINRALPILGIQDFWQRAVVGALILGAIVLDRVLAVRQARKLAEARDDS